MRIKAYVDTNIYVYAIIHHPAYGDPCSMILRDIGRGAYEAYGSTLVALELLGSLSKISPRIARRAVEDYLSLGITLLNVDEEVIRLASIVNEVVNIRYDSIHASLVLLNGVPVVITNDLSDWRKVSRNLSKILARMEEEGYVTTVKELRVVSPKEYRVWRENNVAN